MVGHETVVESLLARDDISPNPHNGYFNPLSLAAREGYATVVSILLARDDIDPNFHNGTPLSLAAQYGHEAVVKLLLSKPNVHTNTKYTFVNTQIYSEVQKH